MARRNRKSRQARVEKTVKRTAEDARQEKSFFLWTGAITLLIVVALYFVLA